MSTAGRAALTKREGVRLKAYKDSVGVLTIGIGHTSAAGPPKVTPDLRITSAECDEIFARDLMQYESAVRRAVKVPLAQNEFDACVSFCYNIGTGGFARSTVAKLINAGDKAGAAQAFMAWSKPPEIIGRRRTEQKQFLTPYKSSQPEPSPTPNVEPVPTPPDGDPEVYLAQKRLKQMGYNPGGIDGRWGGMTAGAIAGFNNDRGRSVQPKIDDALKAELAKAESENFTRPIATERANPTSDKLAEKAPEIVPVKRSKIAAFLAAGGAFVMSGFNAIVSFFKEALDWLTPVKDFASDVPTWVWLAVAGATALFIGINSAKGVSRITESVQTGERP